MSWVAVAVGGGAIVGSLIGGSASRRASAQAAAASREATAAQLEMFRTINQQGAPYRQAGVNALNAIQGGFGLPSTGFDANGQPVEQTQDQGVVPGGYFGHQFNAADLNAFLAPNYAFMLNQGQTAATNALNLSGGLGGNYAKGLIDYTQNYAGNAYQNAFANYTANQQNIFNRLSTIAGYGTTANQTIAGAGSAISPGMAQSITGMGQAQAAGTIGQANAWRGGINDAASWYAMSRMGLFNRPQTLGGSTGASEDFGMTGRE